MKKGKDFQIEILKKMKGEEKIKISFQLIELQHNLILAGIKNLHPEYDNEKIELTLKKILLGKELFEKVYKK
jgi:hypothetical protein